MTELKETKKPVESFSDLICPVCNKKFYYYRIKKNDYQCRNCGCVFFIGKENKILTTFPWSDFLKLKGK